MWNRLTAALRSAGGGDAGEISADAPSPPRAQADVAAVEVVGCWTQPKLLDSGVLAEKPATSTSDALGEMIERDGRGEGLDATRNPVVDPGATVSMMTGTDVDVGVDVPDVKRLVGGSNVPLLRAAREPDRAELLVDGANPN